MLYDGLLIVGCGVTWRGAARVLAEGGEASGSMHSTVSRAQQKWVLVSQVNRRSRRRQPRTPLPVQGRRQMRPWYRV